jgi:hypothetical protein
MYEVTLIMRAAHKQYDHEGNNLKHIIASHKIDNH